MDMPPDLTLSSAFFMSSSDQCTAAVLDNSIPTYRGDTVLHDFNFWMIFLTVTFLHRP